MGNSAGAVLVGAVFACLPVAAAAGPPFLTDDPEPVDYGHYEAYLFSQWDNVAGSSSTVNGPAFEFNAGVLPNVQVHVVAPYGNVTARGMPTANGYGDTEVGVKYRFIQETPNRPQVGIFPAAEFATGDAARGLGNGQTWYRLPIWVQKSWDDDKWTSYGGGGLAVNHAPGQRNYGFGGLLLQRAFGKALSLGAEIYTQGPTANGLTPATFYNVGGAINPTDRFSILFSLGHSIAGASQAIGYVGLYVTFPRAPSH